MPYSLGDDIMWVWVLLGILLGLVLMGTIKRDEIVAEGELPDEEELLDDEILLFLLDEEEENELS